MWVIHCLIWTNNEPTYTADSVRVCMCVCGTEALHYKGPRIQEVYGLCLFATLSRKCVHSLRQTRTSGNQPCVMSQKELPSLPGQWPHTHRQALVPSSEAAIGPGKLPIFTKKLKPKILEGGCKQRAKYAVFASLFFFLLHFGTTISCVIKPKDKKPCNITKTAVIRALWMILRRSKTRHDEFVHIPAASKYFIELQDLQ